MNVNITVVTHNRINLTKICLRSLLGKTRGDYRVTVVDNASTDGTVDYLRQVAAACPQVQVFTLRSNMGVAVAANLGWASIDADYYLKLDNDIEIRDGNWLTRLVDLAESNPGVAMAGYLLLDWKCRKEEVILPDGGQPFIASDLCNGGCVLIPRRIHAELGFWIEDHGKYGYEDKNYSDRANAAGYLVGYCPADPPPVVHLGFAEDFSDGGRERAKKANTESKQLGEQLYVFNKLLFDSGIRKLYVERRYLPESATGDIRFRLNPAYLPIIKIQRQYLSKIRYQEQGAKISVDLSGILP